MEWQRANRFCLSLRGKRGYGSQGESQDNILGMECIGGDFGVHGGSGTAKVNSCGSTAWARALPREKGAESCGHSCQKAGFLGLQ